jgi:hypothetical protein
MLLERKIPKSDILLPVHSPIMRADTEYAENVTFLSYMGKPLKSGLDRGHLLMTQMVFGIIYPQAFRMKNWKTFLTNTMSLDHIIPLSSLHHFVFRVYCDGKVTIWSEA